MLIISPISSFLKHFATFPFKVTSNQSHEVGMCVACEKHYAICTAKKFKVNLLVMVFADIMLPELDTVTASVSSSSLLAEAVEDEASSSLPAVASLATTSQRIEAKDMKAVTGSRSSPSMGLNHGLNDLLPGHDSSVFYRDPPSLGLFFLKILRFQEKTRLRDY